MSASRVFCSVVIYGLGFAAVYAAAALLYVHAYPLRDQLELNELERYDTRYVISRIFTVAGFGVLAAGLACIPILRNWSSLVYLLLFPILRAARIIHNRRRARYLSR